MQFYDDVYTEWLPQRWTYDTDPFSDWSTLPEYVSSIRQIASGEINEKKGAWLLDTQSLYFVYDINASTYDDVAFVNISDNINLFIGDDARICPKSTSSLYVISRTNVTLLDCSPSSVD